MPGNPKGNTLKASVGEELERLQRRRSWADELGIERGTAPEREARTPWIGQ